MFFLDKRDNLWLYIFSSGISDKDNPFDVFWITLIFCLPGKERCLFPGHRKNDPDDRVLSPLSLS
jgi:hypothetical protein